MNESITQPTRYCTGYASLAARGVKVRELDLSGPLRQIVRIAQKTVKHAPIDKLYDAFSSLLAYVTFYDQRGGIETSFKGEK